MLQVNVSYEDEVLSILSNHDLGPSSIKEVIGVDMFMVFDHISDEEDVRESLFNEGIPYQQM